MEIVRGPQGRLVKRLQETSSTKGNNRSPDSKSSKYFEYSRIKDFLNWSRVANSAVHGWIRQNFKLI